MAYDAATGNVVLFGGNNGSSALRDTWTWDGATWTKQAPATRPPAREFASMAYDAATGNVVLFGGENAPRPRRHLDLGLWLTGEAAWPITGVLVPPRPARRRRFLVSGRRVQGQCRPG